MYLVDSYPDPRVPEVKTSVLILFTLGRDVKALNDNMRASITCVSVDVFVCVCRSSSSAAATASDLPPGTWDFGLD